MDDQIAQQEINDILLESVAIASGGLSIPRNTRSTYLRCSS